MAHFLLTGATGLLGRYLLRDLLLRNQPVAVVVRPSKFETAAQRIDSVLAHWENQWQRWLPRPVVLQGDVNRPDLGLSAEDRLWVQQNCQQVLHSAASLAFEVEEGEPWRTNVDGLSNLLAFCEQHAIRQFLHISTAYVCGHREGRVLETELDVGQPFGNVYEESKVAGEKLVHAATHLDAYTIFRPAIIVGDTDDGFSTTFHGFYTPLRLLSALAEFLPQELLLSINHLETLGLDGHERKNFVPVQWVSEAMVRLIERSAPQGKTYTLAAEHPTRADHLNDLFCEAIQRYQPATSVSPDAAEVDFESPEIQAGIATFMESLEVYKSYWRDDPQFDMSNTLEVIPDLRPPQLTDELVLKLCQYAIEQKFSWKPQRFIGQAATARDHLQNLPQSAALKEVSSPDLQLIVTGPGGGSWSLFGTGTQLQYCRGGRPSPAQARLQAEGFCELVAGKKTIEELSGCGQLLVTGGPVARDTLAKLIQQCAAGKPAQLDGVAGKSRGESATRVS